MAQFDVHRNAGAGDRTAFPYLLDIQSDFLDRLATRVVVPMMPLAMYGQPINRLNPVFRIDDDDFVAVATELAGVSKACLGERILSLSNRRDEIVAAIDFVLQGF